MKCNNGNVYLLNLLWTSQESVIGGKRHNYFFIYMQERKESVSVILKKALTLESRTKQRY